MARTTTKIPFALILVEMAISVTAVVLFGLAYPDRFRSRLWENGGEEGWNSNPNHRIYFYANHREPPEIPLLWTQRLTDSNLAIAILGLVIFVARASMAHLNYLPRYVNALYDVLLLCLWAVSLSGQASGDLSDPEHPSPRPWYLTRGCSAAWDRNRGYCRIAQATFAVSIMATILYGGRLIREALVLAYQRGRKHERQWSAQDVDVDVESIGDKYSDNDGDTVGRLAVKGPDYWQDQALSPVLAFFPCESERRW
ncbi:hypothetical protein FALBO_3547 [Fusarium albosuccineum]|uniref:MARVEL domain-containing protein n=1 Tax=Fusarium albosuccineum TaxID=1237068 RepID=A0A8H4LH56_9HYPO|nr:hypothetical protein FALBO_3547 [Fusarium albosuccineum]